MRFVERLLAAIGLVALLLVAVAIADILTGRRYRGQWEAR